MCQDPVVIVLGARVFENRLSGTLLNRVEAAREYMDLHPNSMCITTGGKGSSEPCSEGEAAKSRLVELGVSPDRIFTETRSVNTWENLLFARDVLLREGLGADVVISTQKFHHWRAQKMAEQLGLSVTMLCAEDRPGTRLRHSLRECFAIIKFLIINRKN